MKPALGRGLDALIPKKKEESERIVELDLERVQPSREQPRRVFKDAAIKELSESIKEKGVLQPVIVCREDGGGFRLIAGERRLRASRMAGLKKIPAIIRDTNPEDSLEVALIENIQRENLGPIETAVAFQRLMKEFGLTQEELSKKVSKDRATVANYLRLLKLPDEVKELINGEKLSMGHARAIASLDDRQRQILIAREVVRKGLSVRETEALVSKIGRLTETAAARQRASATRKDPQIGALEEKLRKHLAAKVKIRHGGRGKNGGSIEIEYRSLDELDRLLDILAG